MNVVDISKINLYKTKTIHKLVAAWLSAWHKHDSARTYQEIEKFI